MDNVRYKQIRRRKENFNLSENKNFKRIRKQITLPPVANRVIKLLSEEDACSESETIGRIIKYYAETERPDVLEKARNMT